MYFHVANKKIKVFAKFTDFPYFPEFLKNCDFGLFMRRNPGLWNMLNDIASATLYLSFTSNIKALPVLVLKICHILKLLVWLMLIKSSKNCHLKKCWHQQYKCIKFFNFVFNERLGPILPFCFFGQNLRYLWEHCSPLIPECTKMSILILIWDQKQVRPRPRRRMIIFAKIKHMAQNVRRKLSWNKPIRSTIHWKWVS